MSNRVAFVDQDAADCRVDAGGSWVDPITYCSIATAVASIPLIPEIGVIFVRPSKQSYFDQVDIPPGWKVAIIADPEAQGGAEGSVRLGPVRSDPLTHVLAMHDSSKVYLRGIEIDGRNLVSEVGLLCDGGVAEPAELWLDDVEIHSNGDGILSSWCDLHVLRSTIYENGDDGLDLNAGELLLESSVVALNGAAGLRVTGTVLDLRFSDLLNNGQTTGMANILCLDTVFGTVDASILLRDGTRRGRDIQCGGLELTRSLTESSFDAGPPSLLDLFSDIERGELQSLGEGLPEQGRISWSTGDPYFDVDGESRPSVDRTTIVVGANEP